MNIYDSMLSAITKVPICNWINCNFFFQTTWVLKGSNSSSIKWNYNLLPVWSQLNGVDAFFWTVVTLAPIIQPNNNFLEVIFYMKYTLTKSPPPSEQSWKQSNTDSDFVHTLRFPKERSIWHIETHSKDVAVRLAMLICHSVLVLPDDSIIILALVASWS